MTILWFLLAPPGLIGKLWAIGYSVCHQMVSHSYMVNGMQLPLCARCTGLFLGALSSLIYLASQGRKGGFPRGIQRWILLLFLLSYLVDGVNSTLYEFAPSFSLYSPSNILRLTSGAAMGIALGVMLMSLWNQILWSDTMEAPLLSSARQWAILLTIGVVIVLLVNYAAGFLYYPLALVSTAGVVILIAMTYTLLWTLGLKKENTLTRWMQTPRIFLLGGLSTALQIALLDGIRFALTHTWAGIVL